MPFTASSGLVHPTPQDNKPVDNFKFLLNDDIIHIAFVPTNFYAEQCRKKKMYISVTWASAEKKCRGGIAMEEGSKVVA